MKMRYVGPYDRVSIPTLGIEVDRGEPFEVSTRDAARLAEQPDNYEAVEPSRSKTSRKPQPVTEAGEDKTESEA